MQAETSLARAVTELASLLQDKGWTLVTAESCTGGMVASACTDLAGSSAWFEGGVVSYSNHLKRTWLQVDATTLSSHGAVSEQTAQQMAIGARQQSGADIAISTTGIAGPSGGVPGKPVGTVWFGCACADGVTAYCKQFNGNRAEVRQQATRFAIDVLINQVKSTN